MVFVVVFLFVCLFVWGDGAESGGVAHKRYFKLENTGLKIY